MNIILASSGILLDIVRSDKLCLMIISIELYLFIPMLMPWPTLRSRKSPDDKIDSDSVIFLWRVWVNWTFAESMEYLLLLLYAWYYPCSPFVSAILLQPYQPQCTARQRFVHWHSDCNCTSRNPWPHMQCALKIWKGLQLMVRSRGFALGNLSYLAIFLEKESNNQEIRKLCCSLLGNFRR